MVKRICSFTAFILFICSIIAFLTQYDFDLETGIPQDIYPTISLNYFLKVLNSLQIEFSTLVFMRNSLTAFGDAWTQLGDLSFIASWNNFGTWIVNVLQVILIPVIFLGGIIRDIAGVIATLFNVFFRLITLA